MDDFIRALTSEKHRFKVAQERLVSREEIAFLICLCLDQKPGLGFLKGKRSYGTVCYVSLSKPAHVSFGVDRYEAKTGCHRYLWMVGKGGTLGENCRRSGRSRRQSANGPFSGGVQFVAVGVATQACMFNALYIAISSSTACRKTSRSNEPLTKTLLLLSDDTQRLTCVTRPF
ncbi:hypothetical protein [Cupriavidus sp. SW-Y-13]|uniref:hypothetical protein n=1 Tax=Cupriavidus sp. SW-Y-13 TaxID=2653854 RepID=UPI0013655123|nr:hypothetical protein [Cupriavidus sp. SW-Y-13]